MTKCCDIKAGDLRSYIEVQEQTLVPGGMGGQNLTWTSKFFAYAKIVMNSGSEKNAHDKLETQATHTFSMRYNASLLSTDKFIFEGVDYNIRSIDNVEMRNRWMVVSAERGVTQ